MISQPSPAELGAVMNGTPYRAVARIGHGGMGEVFEVEHELLGRRFVAKLLHPGLASDASFLERVTIEARATARLRHPYVVEVKDFCVTSEGRPCLVMEKLRGHTLRRELALRGQLPLADCLEHMEQLLSALAAAHKLGVVHRDLKPDNLFLHQPAAAPRRLKVLDFGLARLLPPAAGQSAIHDTFQTTTGRVVGTPGYVSPEALLGKAVDHRADLYAAGLLLFVMLTGHGPFDHLPVEATLSHAPVPPSRFRDEPEVRQLDDVVMKSLKKNPEERYQHAHEVAAHVSKLRASFAVNVDRRSEVSHGS
jgi:eukaryotic-like serine/threonine-protein kinase